ncbi:MAG: hypothetical protein KME04_18175 [Pleurocapsa minor GSE-CHR-MK-17-07R]|nr:hypothetical protein [Pleurocapsa minor GSE-CHR-MK 17-07R]
MNMSQRARQVMKQWAILMGLLILLHLLVFAAWVIAEPYIMRSPAVVIPFTILYIVLLAAILLRFYVRLGRATSPPEYHEAQLHGLPASAKVLDITQTAWRVRSTINFQFQIRPNKREYQMRLFVTPPNKSGYEALMAVFLPGSQVPEKGDVILVKIHPQNPDVIVMADESSAAS